MKVVKINKERIRRNITGNIRIEIFILAISIIIGCIVGFYQYKSYNAHNVVVNANITEPIDIDSYPKDADYYFSIFKDIKDKSNIIKTYYIYLMKINVSAESRIAIEQASEEYDIFYKSVIDEYEDTFLDEPAALDGLKKETIDNYIDKADDRKNDAAELETRLSDVVNGVYTDNYKRSFQDRVESDIDKHREEEGILRELAEELSGTSEGEIEQNSSSLSALSGEIAAELNSHIDKLNSLLTELSEKENYELLYNKYLLDPGLFDDVSEEVFSNRLSDAIIYAKSIEGTDQARERFWASLLFFVMFGVVIALITGALYERKTKKSV